MNPHHDFLLSDVYRDATLHPPHQADLSKSGLTHDTITTQKIRTVMPFYVLEQILGYPAPSSVMSAYVIPYFHPRGGFMDHVRVRVFPPYVAGDGSTVKYLGPRGASPRAFFPIATLDRVVGTMAPVWIIEGAKKALAVAQLGLPAVGLEGIEGWHRRGTRELLPDFDLFPVGGRTVEVVPDGDWRSNPHVARGAERLAFALEARGARVRIVALPDRIAA